MKNTLLLSSLVVGLALAGCSKTARTSSTASNDVPPAPATRDAMTTHTDAVATQADAMAKNAGDAINSAANTVAATGRELEWKLSNNDIKDDVAAGRKIVRTKAGAPTGTTVAKSDLKKTVEARIRADSAIANVPIDVDADRDGTINLSGKANTIDQVGRAISIALDSDGVTKVESKIALDKQGNAHR